MDVIRCCDAHWVRSWFNRGSRGDMHNVCVSVFKKKRYFVSEITETSVVVGIVYGANFFTFLFIMS